MKEKSVKIEHHGTDNSLMEAYPDMIDDQDP